MPVLLPATQVRLVFYTFTGQYPPLYYGAQEGSLNLASVNAGNSDGLCVGLGGVNGGFLQALTSAKQTRANLSPNQLCKPGQGNYDDYQDRHVKLLAQAGRSGSASASYANTDPCAFSYVNSTRVSSAAGYYEGVCFVDAFDPALCPAGNPKNAAMLYVAPPFDANHATAADFLQAIEATARNIIQAVAGYNAIAAQQKLPAIEALRNTLYSSNIYNQTLQVPHADIAGAILAGFAAALKLHPNCGLAELQFPVGTGPQEPMFASLQKALSGKTPGPMMLIDTESEDPDNDNDSFEGGDAELQPVDADGAALTKVDEQSLTDTAGAIDRATDSLNQILNAGNPLPPSANYQLIPRVKPPNDYESPSSPMGGDVVYEQLPADAPTGVGTTVAAGHARDVATAATQVRQALLDLKARPNDTAAIQNARQTLRAEGRKAATAADAADQAALDAQERANDDDEGENTARASKKAAEGARRLQQEVDHAVRQADRFARQQMKRLAAEKLASRLAVAKGVGKFIGVAIVTSGALAWIFVAGAGRKVVADGVARFQIGDLEVTVPDSDTMVVVDVVMLNGDLQLVKAVHLYDEATKTQVDTLTTKDGGWTAGERTVSLARSGVAATATIDYVLEAVGPVAVAVTDPKKLTITFSKDLKDIIVAAPDRVNAVSIPVPEDFVFVGTPTSTDGAWTQDAANKTVTFTPTAGVPTTKVVESVYFRVGANLGMQSLVILFPAVALKGTATRTSEFTLPTLVANAAATVKLVQKGQNGAADQLVGEVQAVEGTWSVTADNQIKFIPATTLAGSVTSVALDYLLVRGGVESVPATATLTVPAITVNPTPVIQNYAKVTANRTGVVSFAIQGAQLTGTPLADSNGTWAAGATQVTFTPASTLNTDPVTVTISYTAGPVAAPTLTGQLKLAFLGAPKMLTVPNASRISATTVDLSKLYFTWPPTALDGFPVKLWDGSKPVDTYVSPATGATLSVSGSKSIVYTPPITPLKAANDSVAYVFVGTQDQLPSAPAILTLNFSDLPVAYSFTVKGTNKADVLEILFLDHCVLPAGYLDIRSVMFNQLGPDGVTWEKNSDRFGNVVVVLRAAGGRGNVFDLKYTVLDVLNRVSNEATITVDFALMKRFLPMAADCLLSTTLTGGQVVAADVLASSTAFYAKDPKSVKLTGLQDVGLGKVAASALLQKDGKALGVPGEGTWMVHDSGKIGFVADKGLSGSPTAVSFQFSDTQGNRSNQAVVAIDPSLAQAARLPAQLKALDDDTFWATFQQHVSRVPNLDADAFVAITATLAGAVLTLGKPGPNPVRKADFEAAKKAWLDGAQLWDDPTGTAQPVGLFSVCQKLVTATAPGARYWTLELMCRIAIDALN